MRKKHSNQYSIFLSLILIIAITCMAGITAAFFHYRTGEDVGLTVGYTRVDDNISFFVSGDEIISGAIMNQPLITDASFSLTEGSRPVYLRVGLEYQSIADEPTSQQLTTVTALNTDFVKADQKTVKVENEYYWSYYDGYYYLFDGNPLSDTYNELLSISDENISYTLFNEQNPVLFPSLIELFHHFGISHAADNEELKLYVDAQVLQSEYLPSYEFNDLVALFDTLNPKPATNSVIVAFNSLGGSEVLSQIVPIGGNVARPTINPFKLGYEFEGWYTSQNKGVTLSDTPYDFSSVVTSSLVLYAKWSHVNFTLSFDQGDISFATTILPITFSIDDGVPADRFPSDPVDASGMFNFLYWVDSNGDRVTSIPAGTRKNVTLTAMWDNVWTGNTATGFLGGTGTENDPYLIATPAQLDYFRAQVDGRRKFTGEYIKLVNNIKLNTDTSTRTFNSIGSTDIYTTFEGVFLGNNKTISGLYNSILFSYIGQPATIQDLTLLGRRTSISYSFATNNYGTIKNCNNYVTNTNFVHYNYNTIKDCNNYANISSTTYINGFGGIANYNSCTKGSISLTYTLTSALIENCINYGNISASTYLEYVGGIVGMNRDNAHIVNCQNKGAISCVTKNSYGGIGGIVGVITYIPQTGISIEEIKTASLIKDCINDGNITATECSYVAGIIGGNTSSYKISITSIINCVNNGTIIGGQYNAGIFGYLYGELATQITNNGLYIEIKDCVNNGEVFSSKEYTSGILASFYNCYIKISNCLNYGYVHSTYKYTSGILSYTGSSSYFDILNCINYGKIEGSTDVGGLLSYYWASTTSANYGQLCYVSNCVNLGEIVCSTGWGLGYGSLYRNSFYLDSKSTQGGTGAYRIDTTGDEYTITQNLYGNFNKVVDLLNIYVLLYGGGLDLKYWDIINIDGENTLSQVDELPSRYKFHKFNVDEEEYNYILNFNTRPIGYIEGVQYEFVIDANRVRRADYQFLGWFTDDNKYFVGLNGQENKDIDLHMVWRVFNSAFKGSGIESDPYKIETMEDLLALNNFWYNKVADPSDGVNFNDISKYYKQTADITFNAAYLNDVDIWDNTTLGLQKWTPLGNSNNSFTANYDGGNYKINGLYVNRTDNYNGLFGYYSGKSLKNINIASGYIKGSSYTGGVIGRINSSIEIENIYNHARIKGGDYTGGLIGSVNATLTLINSNNYGVVTGSQYTGGLIGNVSSQTIIQNCNNTADVNGTTNIGGIVGSVANILSIENSINSGCVNGTSSIVGGIVGYYNASNKKLTLKNIENKNDVSAYYYAGGIVGYLSSSSIIDFVNVVNQGDITSNYNNSYCSGGIIGYGLLTEDSSISECVNNGDVISTNEYVGGFAGQLSTKATLSGFVNNGNITGNKKVGGFLGYVTSAITINNFTNNGVIIGKEYAGGVIGHTITSSPALNDCINNGQIKNFENTNCYLGGIIAYVQDGIILNNCDNLGEIIYTRDLNTSNATKIGGIIGYGYSSKSISILNSDNKGDITLSGNASGSVYVPTVGGIIGCFSNSSNTTLNTLLVKDCSNNSVINFNYTVSSIYGNSYYGIGGLVGYLTYNLDIEIDGFINEGSINAQISQVGGVIGYYYNTSKVLDGTGIILKNVTNKASITGKDYTGGIAGRLMYLKEVNKIYNYGKITGRNYTGGIAGEITFNTEIILNELENHNEVYSEYNYIGGIFGRSTSFYKMDNCVNTSTITGKSYIGGIVGSITFMNASSISKVLNTGNVNSISGNNIGGIIGEVTNSLDVTLIDVENQGNVTTFGNNISGIIGSGSMHMENCKNTGDITGVSYIGGFIGTTSTARTLLNVINEGDIVSTGYSIGGIIGYLSCNSGVTKITEGSNSGNITSSYVNTDEKNGVAGCIGSIMYDIIIELDNFINNGVITGRENVGGFIGIYAYDDVSTINYLKISNSKNLKQIIGNKNVSGGVAHIYKDSSSALNIELINVINEGDIESNSNYTGGILSNISEYTVSISVENCKNTGNIAGLDYTGGLFSYLYKFIKLNNVTNEGSVIGTKYVGGIAGYASIKTSTEVDLYDLSNSGSITASNGSYAGGLIGYCVVGRTDIDNCENSGRITASNGSYAGGLFGNYNPTSSNINNCTNTGDVMATNEYVGGIFGSVSKIISIHGCSNVGDISGVGYVGSIAGYLSGVSVDEKTIISNIDYTGNITSTTGYIGGMFGSAVYIVLNDFTNKLTISGGRVGGVIGYVSGSILTNVHNVANLSGDNTSLGGVVANVGTNACVFNGCTNTGKLTTTLESVSVGGIIGMVSGTTQINNCINFSEIVGKYRVGGIVGSSDSSIKLTDVHNYGKLTSSLVVGGLVAYTSAKLEVINSINNGFIQIVDNLNSDTRVGGVVGYISGNLIISNYINSVAINVDVSYVGGIAGYSTSYIEFNNVINKADISGKSYIGGLCGYVTGTVNNLYNLTNFGSITSTSQYVGGLFGYCSASGTYERYNLKNYGNVIGVKHVGGIAGLCSNTSGNFENLQNLGVIKGTSYVGGCFGESSINNAVNFTNLGNVIGETSYIGGIVGNGLLKLNKGYNSGNVVATSNAGDRVGGIAGKLSNNSIINSVYNLGDVICSKGVTAGLVGELVGYILNSYNKGTVTCNNPSDIHNAGGILGYSYSGSVYNSVNFGRVINGSGIAGAGSQIHNSVNFGQVDFSGIVYQLNSGVNYCYNSYYLAGCTTGNYKGYGTNSDNVNRQSFSLIDGEFVLSYAVNESTDLLQALNYFVATDTTYEYLSWVKDDLRSVVKLDFGETAESFTISDLSDFVEFTNMVNSGETFNGKNVQLLTDIYLNDIANFYTWSVTPPTNAYTAIGSALNKFEGTFDGLGHTIYGLYMTGEDNIGLFGYIGENGVVQNLSIANAYINGSNNIAGFAYQNDGKIINCCIRDSMVFGVSNIAGMVINNSGIIKNSYTNVTLNGGNTGIVLNNSGTVDNCFSNLVNQCGTNTGTIAHTDQYTITTIDYVVTYEVANPVYGVKDLRRILNVWCYENMHFDSYWDMVDGILVPSLSVPNDYVVNGIYYYMDGGEFNSEPYRLYLAGGTYVLSTDISKEYYHFDGWYLDLELTQKITVITSDMDGNLILYAKWLPNEHKLIYHYNGADGNNTEPNQVVYSDKKIGEIVIPTRTGYMFKGWFANEDFSGDEWTSETMYLFDEDTELYAKWEANVYSLTFVYHDDVNNTIQSVTYGQAIGTLPNPTRDGYTFVSWNGREDGTGMTYTAESIYNIAESITLYAIWSVI